MKRVTYISVRELFENYHIKLTAFCEARGVSRVTINSAVNGQLTEKTKKIINEFVEELNTLKIDYD